MKRWKTRLAVLAAVALLLLLGAFLYFAYRPGRLVDSSIDVQRFDVPSLMELAWRAELEQRPTTQQVPTWDDVTARMFDLAKDQLRRELPLRVGMSADAARTLHRDLAKSRGSEDAYFVSMQSEKVQNGVTSLTYQFHGRGGDFWCDAILRGDRVASIWLLFGGAEIRFGPWRLLDGDASLPHTPYILRTDLVPTTVTTPTWGTP